MTKENAMIELNALRIREQELLSIIKNYDNKDKEETFLSIIKDYVIKEDKETYPDSVFYLNSDGKVLFQLNNSRLWCNYSLVWNVFYGRYGMDYNEIQAFIKDMVEKHFKMRGVTPMRDRKREYDKVEKHFKMRGVTPI